MRDFLSLRAEDRSLYIYSHVSDFYVEKGFFHIHWEEKQEIICSACGKEDLVGGQEKLFNNKDTEEDLKLLWSLTNGQLFYSTILDL